jgi:uncharacterized repeat protein (TIGR03803 family)
MRYQRILIAAVTTLAAVAVGVMMTSSPATAQTETVLHSFKSTEGISPVLGLIFDSSGNLYGVASEGGTTNAGTIFKLTPSGSTWTEKTLYKFKGASDGALPLGSLIMDSSGSLYGTTKLGGTHGVGTAFKLSLSGSTWTKTILHNFGGTNDGQYPTGSLVFDSSGNLFGTTEGGGTHGNGQENTGGTAYKLAPSGSTWTETVIHNFGSGTDGISPRANMIFDTAGNLYGTAFTGGSFNGGIVFQLKPSGTSWTEKIIHNFNPQFIDQNTDGFQPVAGLIFDSAGNLFGTTSNGGFGNFGFGAGIVFELSPSGSSWTETVLPGFTHTFYQPSFPYGGVVFDGAGNLYGTTIEGGFSGSIYKLTPSGGTWTQTILFNFGGTSGSNPAIGSMILDSSGNLYGATQAGGANKSGVVFKLTP